MSDKYILKGRKAVPCPNIIEWGIWMESNDRRVALLETDDGIRVSTVFLGLDHSYGGGRPLLFETMIFGGEFDKEEYQTRCSTYEEAEAMHDKAVMLVRRSRLKLIVNGG